MLSRIQDQCHLVVAKNKINFLLSNQWVEQIIQVLKAEIIVGDHPNSDVGNRYGVLCEVMASGHTIT